MPKRDARARRIDEPRLTTAAFEQRCGRLANAFAEAVGQERGTLTFVPVYTATSAVMSLAGRGSERVERNAGRAHNVVPLCALGGDLFAWVGYREDWLSQQGAPSFHFRNLGFTVHIGRMGELEKPQLLRSEWVGPHDGGFGNMAGHPHWQVDVLESARARKEKVVRFDPDRSMTVREFGSAAEPAPESDMLLGLTLERMHFASAALWWRNPTLPIAYGAESVDDLDRWTLSCLLYLRQELERCTIVQGR